MLAGGTLHFVMFNKLMPWDHLPGTLIAQEAGAMSRASMARPICPSIATGGLLVATDQDTWDLLRREVFTV